MTDTIQLTKKDFSSDQDVRWCPGCGDYAILSQVQKVFPDLGIPKENILHIASSQMDIKGAKNAGLKVCWINRQKEELAIDTPPPDFEIHKLTELLDILYIK